MNLAAPMWEQTGPRYCCPWETRKHPRGEICDAQIVAQDLADPSKVDGRKGRADAFEHCFDESRTCVGQGYDADLLDLAFPRWSS